jgi:L-arabinose isomerase
MRGDVLLIEPYWDFWESAVEGDLRADRESLLAAAAEVVAAHANVARAVVVDSDQSAPEVVAGLGEVHAVVVVSSMAAPPATAMAVLDLLPGVPVVIWAVSRSEAQKEGFSHSDVTTEGSTVGAPMVGSALARLGRPFSVVASSIEAPGAIAAETRRAVAAGRVSRSRILRVGDAMPGYTTVVAPPGGLDSLGISLVDVPAQDFARLTRQVTEADVARAVDAIRTDLVEVGEIDEEGLRRAAAAEVVLRRIVSEHGCAAGAFNCHLAALRPDPGFGIAPCLALGRLTTAGTPFTCTGDVLTSIAMLIVQSLGLPTLYHEVEALDHDTDEAILANSGEHDARLCGGSAPSLVENVWYRNDPITAPCVRFTIPAGPASLVGFVFAPDARLVVAEGAFTGRAAPDTGTPHAGFRFATGTVAEAWARWCQAGVVHHSAATDAHVADDLAGVARHLGVELVRV